MASTNKSVELLKVAELKLLLSNHRLPVSGRKADLVKWYSQFLLFVLFFTFFRVKDKNLLSSQTQQTPTVPQATSCSTNPLSYAASIDSWSLIDEDLKIIPEFTIENVLQYFIYRKEYDGLERQDWKNFKSGGYKLFKEGHV